MVTMNPKLRRTPKQVYADLLASGTLVVTDEDRAITDKVTGSPDLAKELAARGQSDPDIAERLAS